MKPHELVFMMIGVFATMMGTGWLVWQGLNWRDMVTKAARKYPVLVRDVDMNSNSIRGLRDKVIDQGYELNRLAAEMEKLRSKHGKAKIKKQ